MDQNGEANPKSPVGVWQTEFTKLRVPNLYDLLADPFERATESIYYADWQVHRVFIQVPIQVLVGKGLESFKEFPPRANSPVTVSKDHVKPTEDLTAYHAVYIFRR